MPSDVHRGLYGDAPASLVLVTDVGTKGRNRSRWLCPRYRESGRILCEVKELIEKIFLFILGAVQAAAHTRRIGCASLPSAAPGWFLEVP